MNYENIQDYLFLVNLFEKANRRFLDFDKQLIEDTASERTLCGALKSHFENIMKRTRARQYNVDIEYNRNYGNIKAIINKDLKKIDVVCDLIIHSRGCIVEQDNLIALEMKKADRSLSDKIKDKDRLIALTKSSYNNDVWSYDGKTLPEFVCRYILGIYYEVDIRQNKILLEYYRHGEIESRKEITIQ